MKRPIHYRSMGYFDAVRRYGSIREAARRLDVAASAVNRQILKFEGEVGLPLFERLADGMKLTPAGEIFARHAIAVLQDEKRAASELDALKGLRRGEISMIAVESLNAAFLPALIERMVTKYPGIALKVRTAGSNSIPSALAAGDADLGLAFSLYHHPELTQVAVGRFRLGAVMRPDHALAREAQVTFPQCVRYPLVLPSADLSIHTLLEPQLRRFRGKLETLVEASSIELIKNLTLRLGAIAFQSRIGLEAELASGRLVHVPLHGAGVLTTELGVYLREGRALPVALDAFIALVRDELSLLERQDAAA
ncbi:transcriptional regulator [Aliidongia dinghuensis]|uniref:Transcriptional regulator n=1 Tax=Aliidongia dinghuensis TaxID=1867774 RepID=A0A8J2YRR1_9PROT|nr:LysR family transcriptional regulator [Aliidongia dinghuensis]GGF05889.1 transcriptional regulator [Aliidongia dinghuensis]